MSLLKCLSFIISLVLITGCVYKMDIQQGNDVKPEQVEQLRLGMTEDEVRRIMGTPLLKDPFSPGRWDYIYQLQQHGDLVEERRVTVFFDDDRRLVEIEKVQDL